ncbi:helix-turn-helix transcriptional regulator [Vibrio astriarenae]
MSQPTHVSTRQHMVLALELYKRVPHWHKVTANELQEQLMQIGIKRDIRTIQRNLDVLVEYFDIERDDRDKPYGYQRKQRKSPSIGPQEALLLCLAEAHIRYLLPANIFNTLNSIFEDAKRLLSPPERNTKEKQWLNKVSLCASHMLAKDIDLTVFEKVSVGLYHNRWLKLTSTHSELNVNDCMPLALIQRGAKLVLACRKRNASENLFIELDKIQKAVLSTFTFDYPDGFELSLCQPPSALCSRSAINLRFEICKLAGQHLYHAPLSADQQLTDLGEKLQVTATVTSSAPLLSWLEAHKSHISKLEKTHSPIKPD